MIIIIKVTKSIKTKMKNENINIKAILNMNNYSNIIKIILKLVDVSWK